MKKLFKAIFTIIIGSILMTSCMTTKTPVGEYLSQTGTEYTYDKGKQFWVFWGLVPIGRTHVNTPSDGNCEVVSKFKFTDVLISGLTGGILTSYSIKVNAKKGQE
jgi:hypothetical protein